MTACKLCLQEKKKRKRAAGVGWWKQKSCPPQGNMLAVRDAAALHYGN